MSGFTAGTADTSGPSRRRSPSSFRSQHGRRGRTPGDNSTRRPARPPGGEPLLSLLLVVHAKNGPLEFLPEARLGFPLGESPLAFDLADEVGVLLALLEYLPLFIL